MVESALYHVRLLEKFDFNNIVISIKNSNVPRMMEAYRQLSAVTTTRSMWASPKPVPTRWVC